LVTNSLKDPTVVGTNAGPFIVGPTNAAPICATACGRNDESISLENTPGLTILSATLFS
jgi:hypothetical protein